MSYFTGPSSGGMAIDGAVTDATHGSVFFAGVDGVLNQNNSHFLWDDTNRVLRLGDSTGNTYDYPLTIMGPGGFSFAGGTNVNGWLRSGYAGIDIGGYKTVAFTDQSNTHAQFSFNQNSSTDPTFTINSVASTKPALALQLAAAQTANALTVKDSGGGTVLALTKDGMFNVTFDAGFRYSSTHYIVAYNGGAGQYFTNSVAGDVIVRGSAGKSVRIGISTTESLIVDDNATGGNTRLLVYDVDNGQVERVSVGAADSGGSGYKVLRIPN